MASQYLPISFSIYAAALLVVAPLAAEAAPSTPLAAPRIERVVVFTDRAEVTRVGEVLCGPDAQLEFAALPPSLDPASLRAEAGAATVESVESLSRPRAQAFSPQAEALEEQLRAVALQLSEQRDAIAQAQEQARAAEGFAVVRGAQMAREMALASPDVKAWSAAGEQLLAVQLRSSEEQGKARARLRELERNQRELSEQRARLAEAGERSETFARVRVSCAQGQRAKVSLSYVVGGASWSPAYEARAEEPAGGEGQGAVELSLFGTVAQHTGEPWEQAQLILSTALPQSDATPPELAPLRVYAEKREPPKKVLVRREEKHEHAEAGAAAPEPTSAEEQGLSARFPVSAAADVRGDGTPARVALAKVRLPAAFAWRVVPSQLPYVFRAADLQNRAPFALLPGPVDLFRQGGLMGRAQLSRVASGAPFHLSFGLEERLRVKRVVVEELSKETGVFSKGKRFRYRYAIELESLLPAAAGLEVDDRVPVSELDDVEVALDEQTTPGFELQKEDGRVRWKTSLMPGEKRRLELAFHVDVPSSYDLGGL